MNASEESSDRLSKLAMSAAQRRDAPVLLFVANQLFALPDLARAEACLLAALAIDPGFISAREVLAALYEQAGDQEAARRQCDLAYANHWCITDLAGPHTEATVLLAMRSSGGHIPPTHLFPAARFTKIRCMLDYAKFDPQNHLPTHDVIFNLLGDPDWLEPGDPRLAKLCAQSGRPLLNRAEAVALTRRDRLPMRLSGIPFIDVPRVHRLDNRAGHAGALADQLQAAGARYPLLLRPWRAHGGAGVVKLSQPSELSQASFAEPELYATEYREYRSADGGYRKYRVVFVGGKPYPYHLAISSHWLVHYFSAAMLDAPGKLEEERRFLEDPSAAIGAQAFRALEEIGRRLELDYAGIDFSLLPDGTLLVFEANATMLVHPEDPASQLAHKNRYVEAIVDAVGDMIVARAKAGRA